MQRWDQRNLFLIAIDQRHLSVSKQCAIYSTLAMYVLGWLLPLCPPIFQNQNETPAVPIILAIVCTCDWPLECILPISSGFLYKLLMFVLKQQCWSSLAKLQKNAGGGADDTRVKAVVIFVWLKLLVFITVPKHRVDLKLSLNSVIVNLICKHPKTIKDRGKNLFYFPF